MLKPMSMQYLKTPSDRRAEAPPDYHSLTASINQAALSFTAYNNKTASRYTAWRLP